MQISASLHSLLQIYIDTKAHREWQMLVKQFSQTMSAVFAVDKQR